MVPRLGKCFIISLVACGPSRPFDVIYRAPMAAWTQSLASHCSNLQVAINRMDTDIVDIQGASMNYSKVMPFVLLVWGCSRSKRGQVLEHGGNNATVEHPRSAIPSCPKRPRVIAMVNGSVTRSIHLPANHVTIFSLRLHYKSLKRRPPLIFTST